MHAKSDFLLRENISKFFLLTGSTIFSFLFFNFIVGITGLVLKTGIQSWQFWLSLILSVAFSMTVNYIFFSFKYRWFIWTISMIIVIASFSLSLWIANQFYDVSYDGQAYHQQAIVELSNNWNPIYKRATGFRNEGNIWLDSYPKAAWINSAQVYKLTHNIESGKLFNTWTIIAGLFMVIGGLLQIYKLSRWWIIPVSLVTIGNPVNLYQFTGYYIDGLMYCIMLGLAVSLLLLSRLQTSTSKAEKGIYFSFFFIFSVLLLNVKLVGIVFGTIFVLAFLIYQYISKSKVFKETLILSVVTFIFSTLIFGFTPYITNIINRGNPLYPVLGKGAYNFKDENLPINFRTKNNLEVLMASGFLESDNTRGTKDIGNYKTPFTYSDIEKKGFESSNTKKGGFGPFFGGAVILGIVALIVFLLLQLKFKDDFDLAEENDRVNHFFVKNWQQFTLISFIISILLLSSALNSASTYARFVPQLYAVIIIILIFLITRSNKVMNIFAVIITCLLLINSGLVLDQHIKAQIKETDKINKKMQEFQRKYSKDSPLQINVRNIGARLKLEKYNIQINDQRDLTCKRKQTYVIPSNESELCLD